MEGAPPQLLTVGTTVMVADIGVVPLFVAVKEGTSPEPLAGRPMAVLEFVHA